MAALLQYKSPNQNFQLPEFEIDINPSDRFLTHSNRNGSWEGKAQQICQGFAVIEFFTLFYRKKCPLVCRRYPLL